MLAIFKGRAGEPCAKQSEVDRYLDDPLETHQEGLTTIVDSVGQRFLAINRGVNDAGTGLEITVLCRIVP